MALTVKSRAPRFRVQIHARNAAASATASSPTIFDTASATDTALLASVVSIQTTRRMGESGTFTLTLLPRSDAAHRWQDVISPMDYVEIDLSPSGPPATDGSATVMRGFVDSCEMDLMVEDDGTPRPAVVISGRDFSKLLIDMRPYFLSNVPPQAAVLLTWIEGLAAIDPAVAASLHAGSTEIKASSSSTASTGGASVVGLTPDQVLSRLVQYWLTPFATSIASALSIASVAALTLDASFAATDAQALGLVAVKPPILTTVTDPLSTTLWDVMTAYSNAPWYELYIEDYKDAPYLVLRPAPWRDIHGAWVQPSAWSGITPGTPTSSSPRAPRFIPIDTHEVTAIAVGRSDANGQVNNWFLTYPAPFEQFAAAARQLGSNLLGGANPSIAGDPSFSAPVSGASDYHLFGWRPFERWTPYAAFPGNDLVTASIDGELNRRLGAAYSFGEYLESGVMTLVRDPSSAQYDPIHLGDYIGLTGRFDEFGVQWASGTYAYVEAVSHDFHVPLANTDGRYTMILGVTRGEAYLDRYPNLRNTSILTPLKNAALTTP